VPNLTKIRFDIKSSGLVVIPNTTIKVCEPSWLVKAKAYFDFTNAATKKRIAGYAKKVLKSFGKAVSWLDHHMDGVDGMLLGPRCHGSSFGLQFTATVSAGAAKVVGGSITLEAGFQVGCMDSLPGNFQGHQGSKRMVIVPMWGFGAAVSFGFASPGAGIDANVYLYMPFSWYDAFGHELSIGASLGAGPKPGMGGAADIIFGCCTSPLSNGGVPIDIVTKSKSIGGRRRLNITFKYPTSPYVRIALTGGHVAVQIVATPAEPYAVRLLQPSTGVEIKTKLNTNGEHEWIEPDKNQVALLQEQEKAKGIEGTINIGYARACRHYTARAAACFSQFNP
jgi:hypothetical protein